MFDGHPRNSRPLPRVRPEPGGGGYRGRGSSAFIILIESTFLVALAFWVEFRFNPPLWVHIILWPLLAIPGAILMMRPVKAFLVAQQFRNRPEEMGAE